LATKLELQPAVARQRHVVLRDLIPLGKVRIEVVLAVELGERRDLAVQGHRGPHRVLDRLPVDHREHARQAEADRTCIAVGRLVRIVRAARAEHLAACEQLRVHLQTDHDLVALEVGLTLRRGCLHAHAATSASGERTVCHSVACSYACATRKTRASSNRGAITCRPTGSPSMNPQGTDMPGRPARFTGSVTTSHMYIERGSSRSPMVNATDGDVGDTRASTSWN